MRAAEEQAGSQPCTVVNSKKKTRTALCLLGCRKDLAGVHVAREAWTHAIAPRIVEA